jgi:photosystem II stability/assembly factor-like uncharacterized protein
MRRVLLVLLTSVLPLIVPLAALQDATAVEIEALKPVVKDAGAHRWVYDDDNYGGKVTDLVLDLGNPQVLYACGDGGLYRTTDGAQTWRRVDIEPHPSSAVKAVAACGDTLYVKASWRTDVLKSTDAGKSWTPIDDEYSLSDLLIDPNDAATLYAVDSKRGVLKSTDSGTTWQMLDTAPDAHLAMSPDDPKTLWWRFPYEATFESQDNGKTWELARSTIRNLSLTGFEYDPDEPDAWRLTFEWQGDEWTLDHGHGLSRTDGADPIGLHVIQSLVMHRANQRKHFSITVGRIPGRYGGLPIKGVRMTRDGGKTIRPVELAIDGLWLTALRIDPGDRDLLYAATSKDGTYYFSSDNGETWELLYSAVDDPEHEQAETIALVRKLFHHGIRPEDDSRIVCHPADSNILYATSKRAAVLKSEDGGRTWSDAGHGISMSTVRLIACHTTLPGGVYALTEDHFLCVRKWDGSRRYSSHSSPVGVPKDTDPVFALTPHPADGGLVVLCAERSAWLIQDWGSDRREIKDGVRGKPVACVFDGEDPDRLYLLATGGMAETADRGRTWHEHEVAAPENCPGFRRVRQTSAAIIYSAEIEKPLVRSTDLGATWEATELPATDIAASDTAVYVHPANPSHLLVLAPKDGLLRSTDAGRTWRRLTLGFDLRCAAFDPKDPDVFYIASDAVYRTRDRGRTFEKLGNGLATVPVAQIVVSPADGTIYAATAGRGVYRLELGRDAAAPGRGSQ